MKSNRNSVFIVVGALSAHSWGNSMYHFLRVGTLIRDKKFREQSGRERVGRASAVPSAARLGLAAGWLFPRWLNPHVINGQAQYAQRK